jgi:hypothetical protein
MLLAARAWQLRKRARRAFDAWDFERALEIASEAQQVQRTDSGEALRLLSMWLRGAMSRVATPPRAPELTGVDGDGSAQPESAL